MSKILVVGLWKWPWYQEACAAALESLGHSVHRFPFFDDFYRMDPAMREPAYRSRWAALQNRLLAGPLLRKINRRLVQAAADIRPDVVWCYNCQHVFPETVRAIREASPRSLRVQYANDDPFARRSVKPDLWRHFLRSIPEFDVHFAYRPRNVADFKAAGARSVHLLRSYFIPSEEYREEPGPGGERFRCDVVFAGHYEADGRLEMLEAVAGSGCRLNLFGTGWGDPGRRLAPGSPLRDRYPVERVVGAEYRQAISGAKIALCFLSKLNGDGYTRRNFQIPAMKTFMLGEHSDELATLFAEGEEAEYFRSREELVDKVGFYLRHDAARERIARKGYERVTADGHDVRSRMKAFVEILEGERVR